MINIKYEVFKTWYFDYIDDLAHHRKSTHCEEKIFNSNFNLQSQLKYDLPQIFE